MTELSVYEFEDIAWDEICMTGDHTVPGVDLGIKHPLRRDNNNNKKSCYGVQGNVRIKSSNKNVCVEKEPEELVNTRKRMVENKENDSLAPGGDVGSNSYSFLLSQTEKDVDFFDEAHDIKDSGDFLYYGWSDIENLEDVERIFSNEDEFKWFASSEEVEASIEGSNSELKFQCSDSSPVENESQKHCFDHLKIETHLSVSDTCMNDASDNSKNSSWLQEKKSIKNESLGHFSFGNGICKSNIDTDFKPIDQLTHGENFMREAASATIIQEGTSVNSASAEISLEDDSFCQLQHVMEQLDMRTKLCIRDSLYRLARSAAQRRNNGNLDQDTYTLETSNICYCRYTEFIDLETDTNPIDRSIAHLLFHKPSDHPTTAHESSFHNNNNNNNIYNINNNINTVTAV